MKSEQLVLALIAIVVGVLGWQTYRQFTGRRPLLTRPTPASTSAPTTTPSILRAFNSATGAETEVVATLRPSPPNTPPETAPASVAYTAQELRDPFLSALPEETAQTTAQTAVVKDEPPPTLHVEGLMYVHGIARAIIDGHIVGEGDYIGTVQVIQIMRDGVLVGTPNRQWLFRTNSALKK